MVSPGLKVLTTDRSAETLLDAVSMDAASLSRSPKQFVNMVQRAYGQQSKLQCICSHQSSSSELSLDFSGFAN